MDKQGSTAEEQELLRKANELVAPYRLKAEFLGDDVHSVGVQGDQRTYTRVINLIGEYPGADVLRKVSSEISGILRINRTTIEIS